MADIRDPWAFILGRWNWTRDGYESKLPRGSQIGDLDGFLELSGRHLFIEVKDWHGEGSLPKLPGGQAMALRSLCRHDGQAVLIVYGCPHMNRPYYVERWKGQPIETKVHDFREMDDASARASFNAVFQKFVEWAEAS